MFLPTDQSRHLLPAQSRDVSSSGVSFNYEVSIHLRQSHTKRSNLKFLTFVEFSRMLARQGQPLSHRGI